MHAVTQRRVFGFRRNRSIEGPYSVDPQTAGTSVCSGWAPPLGSPTWTGVAGCVRGAAAGVGTGAKLWLPSLLDPGMTTEAVLEAAAISAAEGTAGRCGATSKPAARVT